MAMAQYSTGFYHDPTAGWYYSTRDACYYAFQNNTYVLLDQMNQPQGDNSHSIATAIEEDCASCHESQQNHYSRPSEWCCYFLNLIKFICYFYIFNSNIIVTYYLLFGTGLMKF